MRLGFVLHSSDSATIIFSCFSDPKKRFGNRKHFGFWAKIFPDNPYNRTHLTNMWLDFCSIDISYKGQRRELLYLDMAVTRIVRVLQ